MYNDYNIKDRVGYGYIYLRAAQKNNPAIINITRMVI